jgi:hypothetical protein
MSPTIKPNGLCGPVTTMDTEIFEFFSLPNELIHQLMQFFEPVTLCRLSQCNHEFNELANADHLWQRLIPVYKGKIISVGVDVITWKKIFRESKKHEDIEEAMDIPYSLDTPATRIILSPGVYPVEIKFDSRYMEVLIEGLYGNPWSEKEDFEKTILTQPKDKDQPLFITYGDATLKNLILKTERGNLGVAALGMDCNMTLENCEIEAKTSYGVGSFDSRGKTLTLNKCHVSNCMNAIAANGAGLKVIDSLVHNCAGALEIKDQLEPVSIVNSVFHHISTAKVDSRAIAIANSKNIEFKNCQIYACQGTAFWIMHTVITIEDCSIYDNKLGVMVFEKGNLTFRNNKITKNLNGMVIRPLYTLTSFENNEFSDNQEIALNVMRYTTDNPLTEDWIKSQNKFERNTTNITISTREGIDFGDEPASDIGVEANDIENQKQFLEKMNKAIKEKICTFTATHCNFVEQDWYECFTCGLAGDAGCCASCAEVCHKDHAVSQQPKHTLFYCDCGSSFPDCKALKKN